MAVDGVVPYRTVQGVQNFKERCKDLNALYIFVSPPSFELLESRLRQRGTDDDATLNLRLSQCGHELAYARVCVH